MSKLNDTDLYDETDSASDKFFTSNREDKSPKSQGKSKNNKKPPVPSNESEWPSALRGNALVKQLFGSSKIKTGRNIRVGVSLPPEMFERLNKIAASQGITANMVILEFLKYCLNDK